MGLETVRKRKCGGVDTLQAEYFAATLAKKMGMHVAERMMLATAQLILEAPAAVIYGMHISFSRKVASTRNTLDLSIVPSMSTTSDRHRGLFSRSRVR